MTPIVLADRFSLAISDQWLLTDVSFALEEGGYLSVIGPNGAGKSTLIKALLRLHDQAKTKGGIFVKGESLAAIPRKKLARLIGYAPQAGGFIPPYTIKELVRLSRYAEADKSRDERAVERALTLANLTDLADRPLVSLSGGERQKAYLAAALAQETPILALDEPSSFLDPKHAFELDLLLKKLNQEDRLTIITVTHDLNHPSFNGGLALVLQAGRVTFFGEAKALFDGQVLEKAFDHRFVHLRHPVDGRSVVLAQ